VLINPGTTCQIELSDISIKGFNFTNSPFSLELNGASYLMKVNTQYSLDKERYDEMAKKWIISGTKMLK
jgi:hypothetical protein